MTRIKPYSKKRSSQLREYKKVRIEFLEANPLCQVCHRQATEIHHRKGRIGQLLINTNYFLSTCRKCHNDIEANPEWAKQHEYSLNRL